MMTEIHTLLLSMVVVLPLLLAIPILHSRLPWPRYLAIMPAMALVVLPGDASLTIPWLFFGTELAIDNNVRWILAMSVTIWFSAAMVINLSRDEPSHDRVTTLFLLTLSGNLGAILATDLVALFSFSTLMGYGFYGLLIHGGSPDVQRAGRVYLVVLIMADLVLFEALLLATSSTMHLDYETVRQSMPGHSSLGFYFWMTFIGFALKSAIWPVHLWLSVLFRSRPQPAALMLCSIPVVMGLLGLVRCLPLGEHVFTVSGIGFQLLGLAALLYAVVMLFMHKTVKLLTVWVSVAATGLLMTALGMGLKFPALWREYAFLSYPFIASLGLLLATSSLVVSLLPEKQQSTERVLPHLAALRQGFGRLLSLVKCWASDRSRDVHSLWNDSRRRLLQYYQHILVRQKPVFLMAGWNIRITLFVLLGLGIAWLAS